MRVSEILHEGVDQFLSLAPSIENHMQDTDNPHEITKETVGLGNVSNALQATDADFSAHRTAAVLDHPDKSVTAQKLADKSVTAQKLAAGAVTAEKLAEGAVGGEALSLRCVGADHLTPELLHTVSSKVQAEDGKGLSQNDFTNELCHKLEAISVTDGTATIDAAALVSRTAPLKVRKTGATFEESDSARVIEDVQEILKFETYPANQMAYVSYMRTDGKFGCTYFKKGQKHSSYVGGEGKGVCTLSLRFFSEAVVAEVSAGVLTLQRAAITSSTGTFSSWMSMPLTYQSEIDLRHVFVRNILNEHFEVTAIYYTKAHDSLYIDCFTRKNSSDITLKWTKRLYCNAQAYKNDPANFFASWNRLACIDGSGFLYVAPGDCTTEPYCILKFDATGEIVGRFRSTVERGSMIWELPRDLILDGKYLYGFMNRGLMRFDTDTGAEKCLYVCETVSYWEPRGLMRLTDGRLALYAKRGTTGVGHLLVFPLHCERIFAHNISQELQQEITSTPFICRSAPGSAAAVEGLYLDEETHRLTSKLFSEYTQYEIL